MIQCNAQVMQLKFPLFAMEDIVRKNIMRKLSVNVGRFVDYGSFTYNARIGCSFLVYRPRYHCAIFI